MDLMHLAHEMGGSCSIHEDMRNLYAILVRKPEGKYQLEAIRNRV